MKATNILKKIYKNNPDIRVQRNNVDINFTIHNFNDISEAIKELEELENRSCIGCVNLTRSNSQDCISCSRQYQDNFKIIKNNLKITNI